MKNLLNFLVICDKQSLKWSARKLSSTTPNIIQEAFNRVKDGRSVSDTIFNLYKNGNTETINLGYLFSVIERTGIRPRTDHRLKNLNNNIKSYSSKYGKESDAIENINVDEETFTKLTEQSLVLLSQALRNDLIIPEFSGFCKQIDAIFERCKSNTEGSPASYIPQLAKVNPELWGMSLCTVDGQRYSLGNVNKNFTLQSCSKPFTYSLCLNELGAEVVHKYIGQEPSGKNFNDIHLDNKNKPHNPLLNSGAIMSCALVLEKLHPSERVGLAEKYESIYRFMKRMAGGEQIGFNNSVFLSERETADRNFAMAYYMKDYKSFPEGVDLHEVLDLYFQTCSMEVNTESLAVMGATLANGGLCPTNNDKVMKPEIVRDVLSLMYSCGMYNHSGQFAFQVGLPAKSGVSGGIMLVIPNLMGVALYSPRLDDIGNSVRGLQFCRELVDIFNFHRFDNLKQSVRKLDPTRKPHESRGLTTLTLMFAAVAGDVSALHRHYLQGVDMCTSDYDGRTALHLSAAEGHLEAVAFLLDKCKVDPSPKDRWGFTPESEAERFKHQEVLELIISNIKKSENVKTDEEMILENDNFELDNKDKLL